MTLKWSRIGDKYFIKAGSVDGCKYEIVMEFTRCLSNGIYKQVDYSVYKNDVIIRRYAEVIPLTLNFNNHFTIDNIMHNVTKFFQDEGMVCTDVLQL